MDQLWDAVKPLINSQVPAMRDLLHLFGVGKEDRPVYLREFASVQELLHLYREESPGVNEQEHVDDIGEDDEDKETEANTREDHELEILAEAISIATEAEQ